MNQEPHEWLVIFLVHADLRLDNENHGRPGYVPIQVQKDTLFHTLDDFRTEKKIKIIIIESRFEAEESKLLHRKFIMQNIGKGITKYDLDIRGIDIENGESVKKLFSELMQKERAKRRMVITWGHGSIFGIFLTEETNRMLRKSMRVFRNGRPPQKHFESVGQISEQYLDLSWLETLYKKSRYDNIAYKELRSSFEVLTNQELATSFTGLLGKNEKVNIVIMDNCLMQNVTTQSDLKNVVQYLIAPQSGISYPGFNYDKILQFLNNDEVPETESVVNKIMNTLTIHRKFAKYPELLDELNETWAIHAKKLDNFHLFEESFTAFITTLINHPDAFFAIQHLKDALNECFHYNKFSLKLNTVVDLKVVLSVFNESIKANTAYQDLSSLASACVQSINNIEGYSMLGTYLYRNDTYVFNDIKKPDLVSGLGILFPSDKDEIDEKRKEFLEDPEIRPAFFQATRFLDLLKKMRILNT